MKSKIISSEKDTVGIIFYGTVCIKISDFSRSFDLSQESSGSDASKNVLNFLPLGPPSADRILALKVTLALDAILGLHFSHRTGFLLEHDRRPIFHLQDLQVTSS
jgi:hypothetical protein